MGFRLSVSVSASFEEKEMRVLALALTLALSSEALEKEGSFSVLLRQGFGGRSTRSRDRTGTASLPLVFETSASTNSAIRAINCLHSTVSSRLSADMRVCRMRK